MSYNCFIRLYNLLVNIKIYDSRFTITLCIMQYGGNRFSLLPKYSKISVSIYNIDNNSCTILAV